MFYANTIVLMIAGLPTLLFGRHAVLRLARTWARASLWLLSAICGTRAEFRRRRQHPERRAAHRAETSVFLGNVRADPLLRRFRFRVEARAHLHSVLRLVLLRAEQIAIDRANAQTALRQLTAKAKALFAEGRQLFIFPEGTRRPPGAPPASKPARPTSTTRPACPACRLRSMPACSGRAGGFCASPARFWSSSCRRSRPA